jgi:hypothetical protein
MDKPCAIARVTSHLVAVLSIPDMLNSISAISGDDKGRVPVNAVQSCDGQRYDLPPFPPETTVS